MLKGRQVEPKMDGCMGSWVGRPPGTMCEHLGNCAYAFARARDGALSCFGEKEPPNPLASFRESIEVGI